MGLGVEHQRAFAAPCLCISRLVYRDLGISLNAKKCPFLESADSNFEIASLFTEVSTPEHVQPAKRRLGLPLIVEPQKIV